LAPAGYYLFNMKNAGTPSAAVWIHIGWKKNNKEKHKKFTHIIMSSISLLILMQILLFSTSN
jgi:hypothetical protein